MDTIKETLNNKVTLVTGAGGGIGERICAEFAQLGSIVYLCDINDTSEIAKKINEEIGAEKAKSVICDISSKESVREMFETIEAENDGVDILINNAAVKGPRTGAHSFPEMTYEGFKKTIDIDLSAGVYCILLSLPNMINKKWGRIIFTSAPLSSSGIPAPYLAGKSGFIGLAKQIAQQYGQDNIRTLAFALRHADTPMIRRVIESRGVDVEEGVRKLNEQSLTGKMIKPEEIAKIYSYFAVNASSTINGVTLLSDGGITYMR